MIVKILMTLSQCVKKIGKARDVRVRRSRELICPVVEQCWVFDVKRPIRTECRKYCGRDPCVLDAFVMLERGNRIVRGTDVDNTELLQDPLHGQIYLRELFVRAIPDLFRGVLVEQLVNAEVTLQLQVRPVIQRITKCVRDGPCPRQEFFVWVRTSGAVPFRDTVGAHCAPLIVITFKPYFSEIAEAMIVGNLLRRKMAVIIKDGLIRCVFAKKVAGGFCSEKKIFRDESHTF